MNHEQIVKEKQNGILCYLMGKEENEDGMPYVMNEANFLSATLHDGSKSVNDLANVKEHLLALQSHPSKKKDSVEKGSDMYMEKSVAEHEVPELVVNSCSVVKDIYIDEGVPTQDKVLFENGMPEDDQGGDNQIKEQLKNENSSPDAPVSPKESMFEEGVIDQCDPKVFRPAEEELNNAKKSLTISVSKELTLGELLLMPHSGIENSCIISPCGKSNGIEEQSCQTSSGNQMLRPALASAAEELENACEDVPSPVVASVVEESNHGNEKPCLISLAEVSLSEYSTNDVSHEPKLETASITMDFDSSAPTASSTSECHQSTSYHQVLETRFISDHVDVNGPLISNKLQYSLGESSFSATVGPRCHSGSIPYSGNISHRSDSSSTSTHSFAFPVLQSEWNSSPVRMARADRRRLRKRRGWRYGLLCCTF